MNQVINQVIDRLEEHTTGSLIEATNMLRNEGIMNAVYNFVYSGEYHPIVGTFDDTSNTLKDIYNEIN